MAAGQNYAFPYYSPPPPQFFPSPPRRAPTPPTPGAKPPRSSVPPPSPSSKSPPTPGGKPPHRSVPPPSPSAKPPPAPGAKPPRPSPPPPSPSAKPPPAPGAKPPRPSLPPPSPSAKPPRHSIPPPSPFVKPPPHPNAPPPPHIAPTPPAPSPSGGNTTIIIVFVSLGGLFFLAFLSVALFCFMKKKKKEVQKAEIIGIEEHRKVEETIVPGPNGTQTIVLSVEEDVHIQEAMKKEERVGEGLHNKSVNQNEDSNVAGTSSSGSEIHHLMEHKH